MKQNNDVADAEKKLAALRTQRAALAADIEAALQTIEAEHAPQSIVLDTIEVAAKKADLSVEGIYLAWG